MVQKSMEQHGSAENKQQNVGTIYTILHSPLSINQKLFNRYFNTLSTEFMY